MMVITMIDHYNGVFDGSEGKYGSIASSNFMAQIPAEAYTELVKDAVRAFEAGTR